MHGIGHLPVRRRQRDNIPKNVPNNGKSRRARTSRIDFRIRAQLYVNYRRVNFYFRRRKCFLNVTVVVTVSLRPRQSSRHSEWTVLINCYFMMRSLLNEMLFYMEFTAVKLVVVTKFESRRLLFKYLYLHFGHLCLCSRKCMFYIHASPCALYKIENWISCNKIVPPEFFTVFIKGRKTGSFKLRRIKMPTYFSAITRMKFSDVLKWS